MRWTRWRGAIEKERENQALVEVEHIRHSWHAEILATLPECVVETMWKAGCEGGVDLKGADVGAQHRLCAYAGRADCICTSWAQPHHQWGRKTNAFLGCCEAVAHQGISSPDTRPATPHRQVTLCYEVGIGAVSIVVNSSSSIQRTKRNRYAVLSR